MGFRSTTGISARFVGPSWPITLSGWFEFSASLLSRDSRLGWRLAVYINAGWDCDWAKIKWNEINMSHKEFIRIDEKFGSMHCVFGLHFSYVGIGASCLWTVWRNAVIAITKENTSHCVQLPFWSSSVVSTNENLRNRAHDCLTCATRTPSSNLMDQCVLSTCCYEADRFSDMGCPDLQNSLWGSSPWPESFWAMSFITVGRGRFGTVLGLSAFFVQKH